MAGQDMQFTITGKDQASQVITAVNKKISEFGKDVGRSIVGMVGPMALATMAISKVMDSLEQMKQKAKEAFDWGAGLTDSAAKLGVNAEEFQRISNAADATGESVDNVAKAFKLAADLIAKAKAGNADAIASLAALGISVDDLAKTKPEDVLARLSGAMAAGKDPTEKMAIAMAALGTSAKDLQAVLAKGFDIQGAMLDTEGLTNEEAALLREQTRRERAKTNREKFEGARRQATEAFLTEDPQGKQMLIDAQQQIARTVGPEAAGGMLGSAQELSKDPKIQAAVQAALKERADAKADADKAAAEARAKEGAPAAAALLDKAKADAAKAEAEKAKEPKAPKEGREPKGSKIGGVSNAEIGSVSVKTPPLTVSSLREIGGGVAGESVATQLDLAQVQVNLQERMLDELMKLNNKSGDTIDFTKFPALNGLTPNRTLA
jgi:hypothetical protein